jgi:NAD(P)-dependent dehydrogenase (short-subunit alcohol dehydrogenase family)
MNRPRVLVTGAGMTLPYIILKVRSGPTRRSDSWRPWGQAEQEARRTLPLGRSSTPLDIACLAVFLCSKESEFVVGQTLVADGGTTALMSLFPDFRSPSSARFGTQYLTKA